jgi:putative (di)nucleoside polyphosphate hydrolase
MSWIVCAALAVDESIACLDGESMVSPNFRASVVAIVVNAANQVMAFERSDLPGEWQLPQGGIDDGELPVEAAWRELEEETGLTVDHVDLIAEFPEWTAYQWPSGARKNGRIGQTQRWFTFRVNDDAVEPVPDGLEFRAWKWVTVEWLVEEAVEFRRPSYRRVLLDG